jgi:tetratricopeptide (TPR) repeat protein
VLEAIDAPGALEAYRAALRKAPDSLSAVRGLARLAQSSGDADTLVEATRREAGLTVDPAEAAGLFVRSATLSLERREDRPGAIEDLTRALELCPDNALAPELLAGLLVEEGRADRLADLLARAADSARRPERQAALWLAAATVHADQLKNGGAAVAALKRALRVLPGHVDAHRALVRVYLANHQWPEAVAALEVLVRQELGQTERAEIQVQIGDLLEERLGERDRARAAFTAALELAPGNPPAMSRLARLQLRAGEVGTAEITIRQLLEQASEDADRANALVLSAMLERARGNPAGAEQALCESVTLEGAAGQAAALFPKLAVGGGSWVALVASLEAHIQRCGPLEGRVASWLALAATYADRMSLPRKAFEALAEGLHATGGDRRLIDELINRARGAGQLEEAANLLRGLLERQERQSELWRSLGRLYREMDRPLEARLAANALVALGTATAEDREAIRRSPPRPGWAMPGALGPDQAAALSVDGATAGPAAALIAACAESLGKIAPTDPDTYGLSRRDRLAPGANHPLRQQVDRLSRVMGLECELYQHAGAAPLVTVGLAEPVYLIVSAQLTALPEAQQVFLLSRTLLAVALNLHPVILFSIPDLKRLLDAGTRVILPEFGGDDPHAEDLARRIRKAISRRARKALESAAVAYAAAPVTSAQGWQQAVVRSLSRAAALLGDDVAGALAALSLTGDPGRAGAPLEESSDLLRFWMSEPAARFRARTAVGAGSG